MHCVFGGKSVILYLSKCREHTQYQKPNSNMDKYSIDCAPNKQARGDGYKWGGLIITSLCFCLMLPIIVVEWVCD